MKFLPLRAECHAIQDALFGKPSVRKWSVVNFCAFPVFLGQLWHLQSFSAFRLMKPNLEKVIGPPVKLKFLDPIQPKDFLVDKRLRFCY